jgi:hypothetical protein
MDVAIDDQDAPGAALGLHGAGGDGGVVEDTETLAALAERMVGAAGEVCRCLALQQRATAGADRCPGRAARALDHAGAPRETDGFLGLFRQLTATYLADIGRIMGARQFLVAGGRRHVEIALGKVAAGEQGGAQARILFHREAVAWRQGKHEDIGVEKLHDRCRR